MTGQTPAAPGGGRSRAVSRPPPGRSVPSLLVPLLLASAPAAAAAQLPDPGIRVVAFETEPSPVVAGRTFELRLTLRLAPGLIATAPARLGGAEHLEGVGSGSGREAPAPGDSLDLHLSYPALAYRDGVILLPEIPLALRTPGAGEPAGWRLADGPDGPADTAAPGVRPDADPAPGAVRVIRAGAVRAVSPLEGVEPEERAFRPAADVLGGNLGIWYVLSRLLAFGALALALGWTALFLGRRRGREGARAGSPTPVAGSSRARALAELDRLHALGWHRNGRVGPFYRAVADVVRTYASEAYPECGRHLTLRELDPRMPEGPGDARGVKDAFRRTERVLFAGARPIAAEAEEDFLRLRDWVADGGPE